MLTTRRYTWISDFSLKGCISQCTAILLLRIETIVDMHTLDSLQKKWLRAPYCSIA